MNQNLFEYFFNNQITIMSNLATSTDTNPYFETQVKIFHISCDFFYITWDGLELMTSWSEIGVLTTWAKFGLAHISCD